MIRHRALFVVALLALVAPRSFAWQAESGWKAGVARISITPKTPVWMAGYASRTVPSQGVLQEIWTKALALEDPDGRRAVLVTLDLCGIGRQFSIRVRDAIKNRHKLDDAGIVLACSHTHSSPVVGENLLTMYPMDEEQAQKVVEYTKHLEPLVLSAVDKAFRALAPAKLSWETGRADFAVNRRNNDQGRVPELKAKLALKGPVDHDVPVLAVRNPAGELFGVVFGYACHCTTLDINQISGDYAGFAQSGVEEAHPGSTALFVAGCGADANPLPRRTVELAKDYGAQLADAVNLVLKGQSRAILGGLDVRSAEVPLDFAAIPDRAHWEMEAKSDNLAIRNRAKALLAKIDRDGKLETSYPYPIHVWKLGDELNWIFLGGEVVADYAIRLKLSLGSSKTWVSAYCNDVMAYIPSLRVLKEGGYEGATSMIYYAQPTTWSEKVEEQLIDGVNALLRKE